MERMIWAQLLHLSRNLWRPDAWRYDDPKGWRSSFIDEYAVDDGVWRRVTDRLAASGATMAMIDVADGVVYPSHPELAIKGSWTAEKMAAEVKRLKALGLEVVPKLNFATTHDQWLKEYGRMVGTRRYYEVVRDLINDICDIFEGPRLLHIGLDEELFDQIKAMKNAIGTFRKGKAFWQDVRFYADCCEKKGARPWMFADYAADFPDEFIRCCPKSILQSAWYYRDLFGNEPKKGGEKNFNGFWLKHIRTFEILAKGGFDQVPCGSTWNNECISKEGNNFKRLVDYCDSIIDSSHLKGYLQTTWQRLLPGASGENRNMLGIEWMREAREKRGLPNA